MLYKNVRIRKYNIYILKNREKQEKDLINFEKSFRVIIFENGISLSLDNFHIY